MNFTRREIDNLIIESAASQPTLKKAKTLIQDYLEVKTEDGFEAYFAGVDETVNAPKEIVRKYFTFELKQQIIGGTHPWL